MKISLVDISDMLRELPEVKEFQPGNEYELLICVIGFEKRSTGILRDLESKKPKKVIFINYTTNAVDNQKNEPYFTKFGESIGSDNWRSFTYQRDQVKDDLIGAINELQMAKNGKVLFDISGCASYVLYPVLSELFGMEIDLSIGYAEAKTYFPKREEWEEVYEQSKPDEELIIEEPFETANFQSEGVEDIYQSPLFDEMNQGNKPSSLIAVPNFSTRRLNSIRRMDEDLNKTSSERTFWIVGKPPAIHNQWRRDAIIKTYGIQNVDPKRVKEVCTWNYKEMIKNLEEIWLDSKHKRYLTIGSLGSKMQHIGTFIFLLMHKEIGLWLSEPESFKASKFSEDIGDKWIIEFGQVANLNSALSKYNTFFWNL